MTHISASLSTINMDVAHHKLTESYFHHVLGSKIRALTLEKPHTLEAFVMLCTG